MAFRVALKWNRIPRGLPENMNLAWVMGKKQSIRRRPDNQRIDLIEIKP
jgi:hypothetical protein